ncbi:MAG: HesA/MoeB/ThiF family protein [Verrucomicrobiaceae bacterium]|nr:HesA/MoeB/ThiF family protein [Verrucomicrobiaceae bacterium]
MSAELTDEERERYQWQLWTPGFDEAGQGKLKAASVLISRCGGVGGTVALELAAAGLGRIIIAHGGELRRNDLNRQLLMTTDHIGLPRVDSAVRRLRELNPNVEVEGVPNNVCEANAATLVAGADIVVSAAPLFEERLLMNREAVYQSKPVVHCSMHDMEAMVMVTKPGVTACLACVTPEPPAWWTREFPVFGAVSGTAACIAAMEVIKLITGLGESLAGRMVAIDFRSMRMRVLSVARDPKCPVCGSV